MKKIFTTIAISACLVLNTYAQVGTIDASFGSSGAYAFPLVSGINDVEARTMVILSNDQIVVSTDEVYGGSLAKGKLNKLTSNGSIDGTFGTGGSFMVEDSTYGYSNLILMPNGKFLASWHKKALNNYPFLTMHNANGTLVSTFGSNGRLNLPASPTGGTVGSQIVADANNNIYVMYDYNNGEVIRSYTSTGAINTAFGSAGTLSFSNDGYTALTYTPTSGGRLVLARYDSNDNLLVSQYLLNGQLDFTYGSAGVVSIPYAIANPEGMELYTIGLQSDGKLLVHLVEYNATQVLSRVVRINTNGSLDTGFTNSAQIGTSSTTSGQLFSGNSLVQQADGKILLGGENTNISTPAGQKAFFRLNGDGTIDPTFGTNGLLALGTFNNEYVVDVKLQSTGKILGLVENNNTPAYILRLLNNLNVGILETANINELGLYPNPVQSSFELSYELKEATMISIDLLDTQGRIVHHFQENQRENGAQAHNFVLPTSIASGTYTVSIRAANGAQNNLQIIVK